MWQLWVRWLSAKVAFSPPSRQPEAREAAWLPLCATLHWHDGEYSPGAWNNVKGKWERGGKKAHPSLFCWDLRILCVQSDLLIDLTVPPPQYWWQAEHSHTGAWQHTLGESYNPILLLESQTSLLGVLSLPATLTHPDTERAQPCCGRTGLWRRPQENDLEGGKKRLVKLDKMCRVHLFFLPQLISGGLKKAKFYKTKSISWTSGTNESTSQWEAP